MVKIAEEHYWKYMVVEPVYSEGRNLPYEIGFVGVKGTSIDVEDVEKAWVEQIEDNVTVLQDGVKLRYQILGVEEVGDAVVKLSMRLTATGKCTTESKWKVVMSEERVDNEEQTDKQEASEEVRLKPHQIAEMGPSEILKALEKSVA